MAHGKALWLSKPWMFGRLLVGLSALYYLGWRLIRADLLPDIADTAGQAEGARRARYDRMLAGFDDSEAGRAAHEARLHRLAPLYAVTYAMVFTMVAFDGIMALQPHWFSQPARRLLLHGLVPRRPHAAGAHGHVRPARRPASGT